MNGHAGILVSRKRHIKVINTQFKVKKIHPRNQSRPCSRIGGFGGQILAPGPMFNTTDFK